MSWRTTSVDKLRQGDQFITDCDMTSHTVAYVTHHPCGGYTVSTVNGDQYTYGEYSQVAAIPRGEK